MSTSFLGISFRCPIASYTSVTMNLSMDPMFIIAPTMNLYAYQEIEGEVVDGH